MIGALLSIAWKTKPREPMIVADKAKITRHAGIEGDFRGKNETAQVTVVFEDDWRAVCETLGAEHPWLLRRANLLVGGIANPKRIGGRLRVGEALLEVAEETQPCIVMDKQLTGLRRAMAPHWRGGLSCIVVQGGEIRTGDPAHFEFEGD
jgi:MOSC domain-containing protein YiiM